MRKVNLILFLIHSKKINKQLMYFFKISIFSVITQAEIYFQFLKQFIHKLLDFLERWDMWGTFFSSFMDCRITNLVSIIPKKSIQKALCHRNNRAPQNYICPVSFLCLVTPASLLRGARQIRIYLLGWSWQNKQVMSQRKHNHFCRHLDLENLWLDFYLYFTKYIIKYSILDSSQMYKYICFNY